MISTIPWAGNKLLTLYTSLLIKLLAHFNSNPMPILVILQMPFLPCGGWMAGKGNVGNPQCSSSKLKIVFGILPWSFRVREEKNQYKHQAAWKWVPGSIQSQKVFFEGDALPAWDHIGFPAEFWPDLPKGASMLSASVLLSRSGRQTTAGRVKRWLPPLCSKTIISSCFPHYLPEVIYRHWGGTDGGGTNGARAFYQYVVLCSQIRWANCALLGVDCHSWCASGSSVLIRKRMTVQMCLGWVCASSHWVMHWNTQCLSSDKWPVETGEYIFAKILLAGVQAPGTAPEFLHNFNLVAECWFLNSKNDFTRKKTVHQFVAFK